MSNQDLALSKPCQYARRQSMPVLIGGIQVGADAPIRLQTMANVSTMDTEASVEQAIRIVATGADYLRYTAQGRREATNLGEIRKQLSDRGYHIPLIADIHFNPQAADEALEHVDKVRVNPGNYVDTKTATPRVWTEEVFESMHQNVVDRFGKFVLRAKELGKAIRIGVNHGSLSERMVMLHGDTPQGMVESAIEYLDVCRAHDFDNVVISMKSSNTTVMTAAIRLLTSTLQERGYPPYPLHLGVTEAGEGEDGRIKSAVGIGSLLMDGLGDTIRVSLSEEPEYEIPVARTLVSYISSREPLPMAQLSDSPDWTEYYELSRLDRTKCSPIGKIVGGSFLPIVLTDKSLSNSLGADDTRPDYWLDRDTLISQDHQEQLPIALLRLNYTQITAELANKLTSDYLLILETIGNNPVAEWRLGMTRLRRLQIHNPIIFAHKYTSSDIETFRLQAAADLGAVLLDGWGNGLCLSAPLISAQDLINTQYGILQATRLRMSKTEFISCPGCGRTLYNLQDTIARVKAATAHLKGLKIGIMGCIVNGPGEMADADYGYVGAAPGKIDLYKGHNCIRKGVPQEDAVDQLIDLIKSEGDWVDPA